MVASVAELVPPAPTAAARERQWRAWHVARLRPVDRVLVQVGTDCALGAERSRRSARQTARRLRVGLALALGPALPSRRDTETGEPAAVGFAAAAAEFPWLHPGSQPLRWPLRCGRDR